MFNISKKLISAIFLTLISTNLFSGLLPGTEILVGTGEYKKIESLKVGDQILVYSIPKHRIEREKYKIEKIKKRKTNEIALIETDKELIAIGLNQKIYNRNICKFIPANELISGDKLFSPGIGNLEIKNVAIRKLAEEIELYDISIKDGNLFIIRTEDGTNLLVHNFPIIIAIPVLTILEKVIEAAVVATTMAAISAAEKHFTHQKNNKKKGDSDLDDILKGLEKPVKKRYAKIYKKNGGPNKRDEDFKKISAGPEWEQKNRNETIRFGKTKNGDTIVSRNVSSDGSATLEIQHGNQKYTKIRYPY